MSKKVKKVGRPKVKNVKDKQISIPVTKKEREQYRAIAHSQGYTLAGWIKRLMNREALRLKRKK